MKKTFNLLTIVLFLFIHLNTPYASLNTKDDKCSQTLPKAIRPSNTLLYDNNFILHNKINLELSEAQVRNALIKLQKELATKLSVDKIDTFCNSENSALITQQINSYICNLKDYFTNSPTQSSPKSPSLIDSFDSNSNTFQFYINKELGVTTGKNLNINSPGCMVIFHMNNLNPFSIMKISLSTKFEPIGQGSLKKVGVGALISMNSNQKELEGEPNLIAIIRSNDHDDRQILLNESNNYKQLISSIEEIEGKSDLLSMQLIKNKNETIAIQDYYPETLESVTDSMSAQDLEDAMKQLFSKLAEIHESGTHRDIKPANILIKRDKNKKIVVNFGDFGSYLPKNRMATHIAQHTIPYNPPEVVIPILNAEELSSNRLIANAEFHYDQLKNADIFAMGLTLLGSHKECFLENRKDNWNKIQLHLMKLQRPVSSDLYYDTIFRPINSVLKPDCHCSKETGDFINVKDKIMKQVCRMLDYEDKRPTARELINPDIHFKMPFHSQKISNPLSSEDVTQFSRDIKSQIEKSPTSLLANLYNDLPLLDREPLFGFQEGKNKYFFSKVFPGIKLDYQIMFAQNELGHIMPLLIAHSLSLGVPRMTRGFKNIPYGTMNDNNIAYDKGSGISYTVETRLTPSLERFLIGENQKNSSMATLDKSQVDNFIVSHFSFDKFNSFDSNQYQGKVKEVLIVDPKIQPYFDTLKEHIPGISFRSQSKDEIRSYIEKANWAIQLMEKQELSSFIPDFSKEPVDHYKTVHQYFSKRLADGKLVPDVDVKVFQSRLIYLDPFTNTNKNGLVEWQIATASDGTVWIDRVYLKDSDSTNYGTQALILNLGILNSKPLEYKLQLTSFNIGNDQYDSHYVKSVPYFAARQRDDKAIQLIQDTYLSLRPTLDQLKPLTDFKNQTRSTLQGAPPSFIKMTAPHPEGAPPNMEPDVRSPPTVKIPKKRK